MLQPSLKLRLTSILEAWQKRKGYEKQANPRGLGYVRQLKDNRQADPSKREALKAGDYNCHLYMKIEGF